MKLRSIAGLVICVVLAAGSLLPYLSHRQETNGLWGAALFGLCALYYANELFRPIRNSPNEGKRTSSSVNVSFTDTTITATYGRGETRCVAWNSLTKVGITTTDEGPYVEDLFWGLHAGEQVAVVYPQDAEGGQELLSEMQKRLAGFDNRSVIEAMGSTSNGMFTVWERDGGGSA